MRTVSVAVIASLTLFACGGATNPLPPAADAATEATPADGGADAKGDASDGADCWRCADRAWRNVCVVPAERAPDAESCLHCGEHCVSDPPDAG